MAQTQMEGDSTKYLITIFKSVKDTEEKRNCHSLEETKDINSICSTNRIMEE